MKLVSSCAVALKMTSAGLDTLQRQLTQKHSQEQAEEQVEQAQEQPISDPEQEGQWLVCLVWMPVGVIAQSVRSDRVLQQ